MRLVTGNSKGFTLIEVLIVLVIISIVVGTVSLNLVRPTGSNSSTAATINLLRNHMSFVQQQALLLNKTLGLSISKKNYQFMEYSNLPVDAHWQPLNEPGLATQHWPENFSLQLGLEKALPTSPEVELPTMPQIIFSPSGEVTLFKLYINKHFILSSNEGNEITLETLS